MKMNLPRRKSSLYPAELLVVAAAWMVFHTSAVSCLSPLEENGIEVTYNITKDAVLKCTVKDLNRRKIIWRRLSDPYPISVGGARFSPNRRYRVTSRGETSTLTIRGVHRGDAAEYLCEASGGTGPRETLILNIQAGDDTTYFLKKETTVKAAVGDTVKLPCHVENINENMVLWKNERNQALSLRKRRLSGDYRMRVIHETYDEWSLQIKRLTEDDFGFYTCIVNSNPVLTRTINLVNKEPEKFAPVLHEDTSFQRKVEAKHGETVMLTCNFNAYPPAKVTWYKRSKDDNGKLVRKEIGQGTSFTIRSVSLSEAGDYVCKGDNGHGPPSRGKTKLVVIGEPTTPATTTQFTPTGPASPRLYHGSKVVEQRRGRSAHLECIGIGDPRPSLHWERHGRKLQPNAKYHTHQVNSGSYKTTLTLEIRSLVSRDYGEYECVGQNKLGLIKTQFHVKRST